MEQKQTQEESATTIADQTRANFQSVPTDKISPSRHQARKQFNEESIQALAKSMAQEGLLQPITIRRIKATDALEPMYFELISGERRLRAAKVLGWPRIDAKIIQTISEGEASAKGLLENLQREDLNPIEEAGGFAQLRELDPDYWTQDRICQVCGKSKAYVSRSLSLLGLPEKVKDLVATWQLSRSHAETLLPIANPDKQIALAKEMVGKDWSVREAEKRIQEETKQSRNRNVLKKTMDSDFLADIWSEMAKNPAVSSMGTLKVTYHGNLRWSLELDKKS